MTFTLLHLPEDVLHYSLCLCDVSSVICISQANKFLHRLAFAPTIWISLVEALRNRGFIDRHSAADIRNMSTESLVGIVRRLVGGPDAWSPPKILHPRPQRKLCEKILHKISGARELRENSPQEARAHIVLHPPISPVRPPPFCTEVLRGGRHVLFIDAHDAKRLNCWRVADNSLLGTYHGGHDILDFAAEVLPGGERANIVIRMQDWPSCFMEIISWDFATGTTELHAATEYSDSPFNIRTLPNICGDFVTTQMDCSPPVCIMINYRAQNFCKVICPSHFDFRWRLELIPGHFIFTSTSSSRRTLEIYVGEIASLSDFWVPMERYKTVDPILLSDIPRVISSTVKSKGMLVRSTLMAVHESPLDLGTYRVWLHVQFASRAGLDACPERALLCGFRLSLPGPGRRQVTWEHRSCAPAAPTLCTGGISYSGHTQGRIAGTGATHIFSPDNAHSTPITLQIPQQLWSARLVPYGGALAGGWEKENEKVELHPGFRTMFRFYSRLCIANFGLRGVVLVLAPTTVCFLNLYFIGIQPRPWCLCFDVALRLICNGPRVLIHIHKTLTDQRTTIPADSEPARPPSVWMAGKSSRHWQTSPPPPPTKHHFAAPRPGSAASSALLIPRSPSPASAAHSACVMSTVLSAIEAREQRQADRPAAREPGGQDAEGGGWWVEGWFAEPPMGARSK
ncbi:hypothetical protein C8R44DRAFT_894149 [Mycena epipterygia]|nr:hypothetical protein C8R44DRAFT_894149 [Mycena epipterygia]